MKLSEYFSKEFLHKDAFFEITHQPSSNIPNSICYACSKQIVNHINRNPNITAVFTTTKYIPSFNEDIGIIISKDPQKSYYDFHNQLVRDQMIGLKIKGFVHPSAKISENVIIGKNVIINKGVTIGYGSIILDNTIIGQNTNIQNNVIVGTCGMQNNKISGQIYPILYAGGVKIGESSEILSGAIIQKPYHSFFTQIGNNTQVSVNVIIGHGVHVGNNTSIGGNSQISGNTQIGNNVIIGPSSTISDNLIISDDVNIKIGSVVIQNIKKGMTISGNYAMDHNLNIKNYLKSMR